MLPEEPLLGEGFERPHQGPHGGLRVVGGVKSPARVRQHVEGEKVLDLGRIQNQLFQKTGIGLDCRKTCLQPGRSPEQ
jgi:hypothetical protein